MTPIKGPRYKQRPPRRKACSSCIKSKVRCGLERPACSRCASTRRICEYVAPALEQEPSSVKFNSIVGSEPSYATSVSSSLTSAPGIPLQPSYSPTLADLSSQSQRQAVRSWDGSDGLDFLTVDLIPSANAEDIRDRWLRSYILPSLGQDEIPKVYHPFTLQYISRVLKTYPRYLLEGTDVPPIIHRTQVQGQELPRSLANCYTLMRMWERAAPGSEAMVVSILEKEMERLVGEVPTWSQVKIVYTNSFRILTSPTLNCSALSRLSLFTR